MINQLRSEWLKFRSVGSSVALGVVAAALMLILPPVLALVAKDVPKVADLAIGVNLSSIIFMIIGVQIVAQEYRFKTISSTLSLTPNRSLVFAGKAQLVFAVAGVGAAAVSVLGLGIAAAARLVSNGQGLLLADGVRVTVGSIAECLISAGWGMLAGFLVRQPLPTFGALILWSTVGEGLIGSLIGGASKWLPFASITNLGAEEPVGDRLSAPWAAGYSAVLLTVVGVLAFVRFVRSDA